MSVFNIAPTSTVSLSPIPSCFILSPGFVILVFYIPRRSRIKAERRSRVKAMEERAKRGVSHLVFIALLSVDLIILSQLLTEEEKAVLAAEKAKGKDGDCLIM